MVAPRSYEALRSTFRWRVPARFDISEATVGRQARRRPRALALIVEDDAGVTRRFTFGEIDELANRLANVLVAAGLRPGDRLAILLSQRVETGVAHLAAYRAGLIAVPLFVLFGPEAIEYRMRDLGAVALITDATSWPKVASIRDDLPELQTSIVVEGRGVDGTLDFDAAVGRASSSFRSGSIAAEDPAIIIYTSGTTGPPKGALHAHRFLLGHLPGVRAAARVLPAARATCSGRRPTGRGSAGSSTCCSRPGTGLPVRGPSRPPVRPGAAMD